MGLTVFGGVAYDAISVGGGEVHEVLGGSAVYAGLAASIVGEVTVLGAVGDDCDPADLDLLGSRPSVRLAVDYVPGRTTRFRCDYDARFSTRTTLEFEPGVAAEAGVPARWPDEVDILFLASGPPEIQLAGLEASSPRLTAVDTIDSWIKRDVRGLERVITRSSIVLMTVEELLQFTGHDLVVDSATAVLRQGPRLVCVKQGEFGAQVYGKDFRLALPAFEAFTTDPTGAGDAFAGAFLGHLAARRADVGDRRAVGEALVLATAVSSLCIEDFGTRALEAATTAEVERRCRVLLDTVRLHMPVLGA